MASSKKLGSKAKAPAKKLAAKKARPAKKASASKMPVPAKKLTAAKKAPAAKKTGGRRKTAVRDKDLFPLTLDVRMTGGVPQVEIEGTMVSLADIAKGGELVSLTVSLAGSGAAGQQKMAAAIAAFLQSHADATVMGTVVCCRPGGP